MVYYTTTAYSDSTSATDSFGYIYLDDIDDGTTYARVTTGTITVGTGAITIYGESEEETEEERQARGMANERAENLLKSYIGLEAFGQLYEVGYIELDSHKHEGRKYRIPKEHMEMIDVLDEEGQVIDKLCIHPAIDCPAPDHILSRVILLKFAEEYALAKADHHEPRDYGELVYGRIDIGAE